VRSQLLGGNAICLKKAIGLWCCIIIAIFGTLRFSWIAQAVLMIAALT
jgi:hypothetical protein